MLIPKTTKTETAIYALNKRNRKWVQRPPTTGEQPTTITWKMPSQSPKGWSAQAWEAHNVEKEGGWVWLWQNRRAQSSFCGPLNSPPESHRASKDHETSSTWLPLSCNRWAVLYRIRLTRMQPWTCELAWSLTSWLLSSEATTPVLARAESWLISQRACIVVQNYCKETANFKASPPACPLNNITHLKPSK